MTHLGGSVGNYDDDDYKYILIEHLLRVWKSVK